jgi:hypothetical protein
MSRLRNSGKIMASCFACCAAAVLMIGLAAREHHNAGAFTQVARVSNSAHEPSLQGHAAPASGISASKSPRVTEQYKQFPLSFEPNQQQTNEEVKFLARGEGYILFLTEKDAVFTLGKAHKAAVLRMSLLEANANPSFTGMEELPGKSNYFIGNQPEHWHTNIPNYRKVAERGIYPGIDLVYYGTQRQLEYDYVISPGTSPSKIQIAFEGAKNLHIDARGDLLLSVAGENDVRLHKPIAYQQIGDEKRLVAANYILNGNGSVQFGVGAYDSSRTLIVDPILAYSTYLGGSGIDNATSIAIAPDNTAFVAGSTVSSDFPTVHALQANDGGGPDFPEDAFVSKISSDGSTLLYSTFLGGENEDAANGIAVDNFGDAFVTGFTLSPHYPVSTGAFDTLCGGDGACGATFDGGFLVSNAFVTELNPAGSALIYSTFFGYFENVKGQSIAIDSNNNAYLTGSTTANFVPTVVITPPKLPPPPFPITACAFQSTFGGGSTNAFIAKIDATGTSVLYSSYLGGNTEDVGHGIALDSAANAYITGLTYSTNFPTTGGALQAAFGGAGDGFAAKVNTNASGAASLIYSTYIGGSGLDQGNGIAVDSTGNAYIAGQTDSAAFGFTPTGTFQTAFNGEGDAFVAKLGTTGALSYFTYLGGTKADAATGIAVDSLDNVYVTGSTVSTDFPTSGAVFQPTYGGGNADSFVAKLDPAGATLVYSSFLGGTNTELATGIAVDTAGSAYVTGQTCSLDFPLSNPLQSNPGGNCDAYVAKVTILAGLALNPAGLVFSAQSLNTTSQTQTVTLTNGDNPQTITSIAISGPNAGEFAETNTCAASLNVGATCTITVSFTPTIIGIAKASLTLTDSAIGSPQVVNLTGTTSTVLLSASSLSFGSVAEGATSPAQTITVTNGSNNTFLTISSIAASSGFAETGNCAVSLAPFDNCVINVTYTPSAAGQSIGTLSITDFSTTSAGVSQAPAVQPVQLTGIGTVPSFTIQPVASSPPVPAGQTASYTLSINPDPTFAGQVTLGCIGLPHEATCAASANPVTVAGGTPVQVQILIATAVRTMVPPVSGFRMNPGSFGGLRHFDRWLTLLIVLLAMATLAGFKRRPAMAGFGLVAILLVVLVGCSAGSSPGVPAGTPAGTYQISVTGTSGSSPQQVANLTLQVK